LTLTYQEANSSQTVVFLDPKTADSGSTTVMDSDEALNDEADRLHAGHMKALINAGRELATHLSLQELFELILKLTVEAVGVSRGILMTIENGKLEARASQGAGFRISSHVRDLVINQRRSLLVADTMADEALSGRQSIMGAQVRSMIAAPLQTDEKVIGLIYMDSPFFIKEFTKADLSLVTVMANMAAVRIENARLAEVEQLERLHALELEHAAMIQRSMLPADFPPFPLRDDFQLHAQMVPAREVGGNLFDFYLLDQDRIAFVAGDVSGKGVPAALFMAVSRTLLKAAAQHQEEPGGCLTYVNQSLAEQNSAGMFVTVFYGVLNTRTGELRYANGGHNPPYVYSAGAACRPLKEKSGPMLGLLEGTEYATYTTQLVPGEGILLYTDGVTEALNASDQFFNEQRLEAFLEAHAEDTVENLVKGLHAAVQEFAAGTPRADDVTLLTLRYTKRVTY
jgi:sigma-B regulation protein RsbU (phosphoserine phosphatase)